MFLAIAGLWLVDLVCRQAAPALHYPANQLPAFKDPAALPLLLLVSVLPRVVTDVLPGRSPVADPEPRP